MALKKTLHIGFSKRDMILITCLLSVVSLWSEDQVYRCELGLQGGIGYYVGDLAPYVFTHPREAAGVQFRYKFTPRWALQTKAQYQRLAFQPEEAAAYSNRALTIDATAEYNFFRLGISKYDKRIKPISPYLFIGIGAGVSNFLAEAGGSAKGFVYMPFGFGMKWNFAPHWGLNIAWQNAVCFTDYLEGKDEYGNTWSLNGNNFLNNDLLGTLTLGIVFEFARERVACRSCP